MEEELVDDQRVAPLDEAESGMAITAIAPTSLIKKNSKEIRASKVRDYLVNIGGIDESKVKVFLKEASKDDILSPYPAAIFSLFIQLDRKCYLIMKTKEGEAYIKLKDINLSRKLVWHLGKPIADAFWKADLPLLAATMLCQIDPKHSSRFPQILDEIEKKFSKIAGFTVPIEVGDIIINNARVYDCQEHPLALKLNKPISEKWVPDLQQHLKISAKSAIKIFNEMGSRRKFMLSTVYMESGVIETDSEGRYIWKDMVPMRRYRRGLQDLPGLCETLLMLARNDEVELALAMAGFAVEGAVYYQKQQEHDGPDRFIATVCRILTDFSSAKNIKVSKQLLNFLETWISGNLDDQDTGRKAAASVVKTLSSRSAPGTPGTKSGTTTSTAPKTTTTTTSSTTTTPTTNPKGKKS